MSNDLQYMAFVMDLIFICSLFTFFVDTVADKNNELSLLTILSVLNDLSLQGILKSGRVKQKIAYTSQRSILYGKIK